MPDAASPAARSAGLVARRTLVVSLVALGMLVLAIALWKIRLVLGLFFLGVVIAAAMRPGVEGLHRRGVPRALGVAAHYAILCGLAALLLWFAVPRAVAQTQDAIASLPTAKSDLRREAAGSDGIRQDLLVGLERRLSKLPSGSELVPSLLELTRKTVEVLVGIFFVFATAAYWIFERRRAERVVLSLIPGDRRDVVRETWDLIELKLGAFVRGQLLLIVCVATVLSLAFWAIGLPYWLLIGAFAGVAEIVPVIGPLAAGALAVGAGLTVSWKVALAAGIVVVVVRLLEDYLLVPRFLGSAVGLSPLVVLATISAVGIVLGGFAALLAIPLAAVLATVVDVVVLKKDPAEQDVPTVVFPPSDAPR